MQMTRTGKPVSMAKVDDAECNKKSTTEAVDGKLIEKILELMLKDKAYFREVILEYNPEYDYAMMRASQKIDFDECLKSIIELERNTSAIKSPMCARYPFLDMTINHSLRNAVNFKSRATYEALFKKDTVYEACYLKASEKVGATSVIVNSIKELLRTILDLFGTADLTQWIIWLDETENAHAAALIWVIILSFSLYQLDFMTIGHQLFIYMTATAYLHYGIGSAISITVMAGIMHMFLNKHDMLRGLGVALQ